MNECNSLKISHTETVRNLYDTIQKLKEQIKDLEFQGKNERLNYQQHTLDLQTENFNLKSEVSAIKDSKRTAQIEAWEVFRQDKPQVLRKQAEHIENLTAEITRIKAEHRVEIEEIQAKTTENIKELGSLYEADKNQLRQQIQKLNKDFEWKV